MTPYEIIMVFLFIIFTVSVVIGYIVCHFIVAPILISRHSGISLSQAMIWEGIQAENTLKDIESKTGDKAITTTLKTIKYSKYAIFVSLALLFC